MRKYYGYIGAAMLAIPLFATILGFCYLAGGFFAVCLMVFALVYVGIASWLLSTVHFNKSKEK